MPIFEFTARRVRHLAENSLGTADKAAFRGGLARMYESVYVSMSKSDRTSLRGRQNRLCVRWYALERDTQRV